MNEMNVETLPALQKLLTFSAVLLYFLLNLLMNPGKRIFGLLFFRFCLFSLFLLILFTITKDSMEKDGLIKGAEAASPPNE